MAEERKAICCHTNLLDAQKDDGLRNTRDFGGAGTVERGVHQLEQFTGEREITQDNVCI